MAAFLLSAMLVGRWHESWNVATVVGNATCFKTYYRPAWFILPYAILALCSKWLVRLVDKLKAWQALVIFYAIYMVSHHLESYAFFRANIWQCFYLAFPFVLGSLMAKHNVVGVVRRRVGRAWLIWLLLLLLCIVRCFAYTGALAAVYAATFITLFVVADRPSWLNSMLAFLGRHSTNVWLIHYWFTTGLFSDYFCWLEFSLPLKFVVILAVSIIASMLFNIVFMCIEKIRLR